MLAVAIPSTMIRAANPGERKRVSANVAPETAKPTARLTGTGCGWGSRPRQRPSASTWAHNPIAAATSRPLGFTEPARKNTIGVTAAATPSRARWGRTTLVSAHTADASSAEASTALTKRIPRTPLAPWVSRLTHPTAK